MLFSEFADINPKVRLDKGETYSFVEMEDVSPGNRYVKALKEKLYKGGGSKFEINDVLFARITPCLENGKIAQFKGSNESVGFGSTEFFVFRAKKEVSDSGFLFYLAYSDILRKPAEGSMFGASGRQRAALDAVKAVVVPDISLNNQKKVSAILSAYDDLIENNTRRIQILEEMTQRIYREWFVNFRFPGHEKLKFVDSEMGKIPEGWEVGKLSNIIEIKSGFAFKSGTYDQNGRYGLVTIKNVQDGEFITTCQNRIETPTDKVPKYCFLKTGDLLLSLTGNIGRVCIVYGDNYLLNQRVAKLAPRHDYNCAFVYCLFRQNDFQKRLEMIANGVAQQNLSPIETAEMSMILPPEELLEKFAIIAKPIMGLMQGLYSKNQNLKMTRDVLLPKLISGEVDVSEMDIAIKEQENGA